MAEKYVIFKTEDWKEFQESNAFNAIPQIFDKRITDGTVIRTQDAFAASGLQGYARKGKVPD